MRFKLFNLPVHVSPSFLIMLAIIGSMNSRGDNQRMIFIFVAIFTAVLIHELGHALTARWFGMKPEIELSFIGGQASWVELRRLDYRKRCLITFAGPGIGLIFGVIFYLIVFLIHDLPIPARDFLREHYYYFFLLNIFNLIPIYPMDGAKGIEALIGWKKGHVNQLTMDKLSFNTALACGAAAIYYRQYFILAIFAYFGFLSYKKIKS